MNKKKFLKRLFAVVVFILSPIITYILTKSIDSTCLMLAFMTILIGLSQKFFPNFLEFKSNKKEYITVIAVAVAVMIYVLIL